VASATDATAVVSTAAHMDRFIVVK
jgi:hypothetical protein